MQVFFSRKTLFAAVYVVMCIAVRCLAGIALPALSRAQNPRAPDVSQIDAMRKGLLEAHNQLCLQEDLASFEQVHTTVAHDMLQTAHSSTTSPFEQLGQAGSPLRKVGQIVAPNRPTPQVIMQSILEHKTHQHYNFGSLTR